MSVVQGDPGAGNIVVASDGSVGLIDWDESRVDVGWFDSPRYRTTLPGPPTARPTAA